MAEIIHNVSEIPWLLEQWLGLDPGEQAELILRYRGHPREMAAMKQRLAVDPRIVIAHV